MNRSTITEFYKDEYIFVFLIYVWVYDSHIEGIYKNGGVFKVKRNHRKQFYLRLTYLPPQKIPHTY